MERSALLRPILLALGVALLAVPYHGVADGDLAEKGPYEFRRVED